MLYVMPVKILIRMFNKIVWEIKELSSGELINSPLFLFSRIKFIS